jgi:hypothetical protein
MLRLLLPAIALLAAAPAMAQDQLGAAPAPDGPLLAGEIEGMCLGSGHDRTVACSAFLRGALEGLMFGQISADEDLTFCLPGLGVPVREVRQTFLAFVAAEPERRLEEASVSLLESLEDRYPCPGDEDDEDATQMAAFAPRHTLSGFARSGSGVLPDAAQHARRIAWHRPIKRSPEGPIQKGI